MSGKPLDLVEGCRPCLRCGYCCTVRSCGFDEYDHEKGRCRSLVENGDGTFSCAKYEEILDKDQKVWEYCPSFGSGCCSPLNPSRIELAKQMRLP